MLRKYTLGGILTLAAAAGLLLGGCLEVPIHDYSTHPASPDTTVYLVPERMPEAVGGIEGIQRRAENVLAARGEVVRGTAFVQFIVNADGSVSEATCTRDPGEAACEAAIEAIEETTFRPGIQRGRAVRVRFSIPVRFGR